MYMIYVYMHMYIFVAHFLDVGVYGPCPTYPSRRGSAICVSQWHKHVKNVLHGVRRPIGDLLHEMSLPKSSILHTREMLVSRTNDFNRSKT